MEEELARLESEAQHARPGYVGTAHNLAGDRALKVGQADRAVQSYGRAIDAFLADRQRELARGVANKIIRVRPTAIRTLCTLTWLDLAARHQAMALLHLREYTTAAKAAGRLAPAATQIFEMAKISRDSEFIAASADALDRLDFPLRAEEVRAWATEGAPDSIEDDAELTDHCMDAAVRSSVAGGELLTEPGG